MPNSGLRLHAMLSDQEAYLIALQLHAHKYLKGLWTFACMHCFPMSEIHWQSCSCIQIHTSGLLCGGLTSAWTCTVLPALEHEQDHFTHIKFDGEPTEDIPQLAGLSEAEKRRVAGESLPGMASVYTSR